MNFKNATIPSILFTCLSIAACGGGSSSSGGSDSSTSLLSGTAAAGAAIIGTVTVKGANGNTLSTTIEADGNYSIDVSSLTAPYRLRAQGTVGGKTYKLHSYAEEADIGDTVNITPFTDLIVANAAGQIAEAYFDNNSSAAIDSAELDAQEDALQSKLQEVLNVVGVDAAINLLNSSFSADHSGLDAALDLVSIEVDTNTNIATITNLVENTTISDDINDTEDNTDVLDVVDPDALSDAVTDTQAITNLFGTFEAQFTNGLPTAASIQDYFADDFLLHDQSKGEFLTEITTDPTVIGIEFVSLSVSDLDDIAGTALVTFGVSFNGLVDPELERWYVAKDSVSGDWQLRGNQYIVDINELNYHCNDYDAEDNQPGDCGINVSFWDEDFDNNGPGPNTPIASGTFRVLDGDTQLQKAIVYLGTPDDVAPGDVQIYNVPEGNEVEGNYSWDWRPFGSGTNQIDPALFEVGDILEYAVYTADLDVSTPASPAVVGSPVATYAETEVNFVPSTTPLYPAATVATISALNAFQLGDSLTIAWTLAAGTVSEEVLVEISDDQGNRIEVWDESFASSATSTTFDSTEFDSAAATNAGLDDQAENYYLNVRIYAADELSGQSHSVDYRRTIDGPAANNSGGGSGSGLTCSHESGWNDNLYNGAGGPINPNSFAEFQDVVTDCGDVNALTAANVDGLAISVDGELPTSFDDSTGGASEGTPGTGTIEVDPGVFANIQWWIDANGYLVIYTNSTIEPNIQQYGVDWIRETYAFRGQTGNTMQFSAYSESSNYSDTDRATGSDGEIWHPTGVIQP